MRQAAAAIVLFLLPLLASGQVSPELATLEGVVIDSVTGRPIPSVLVTSRLPRIADSLAPRVFPVPGNPGGRLPIDTSGAPTVDSLGRPAIQVRTDSNGRFSVRATPGRTSIVFGKDNYAVRTLTYSLVAGQPLGNAVVRLVPGGVLAGRVFDSKNTPVASAAVTPYQIGNQGKELSRYNGVKTNDRGEFRLSNLGTSTYLLVVSSPSGGAFYPGAVEFDKAEFVTGEPGKETRLKDVVLSGSLKQGTIRVNVTNGPGEGPKDITYGFANGTFTVLEPDLDGYAFSEVVGSSSRDPVIHLEPNQTFSESHLLWSPGMYRVTATWKDANGGTARSVLRALFTGRDLEMNLSLKTPDGRLSCRAMFEDAVGALSPLDGVSVVMNDAGGTFVSCTTPLRTGEYKLVGFQGIPADAYVASARQGTRDVFMEGLRVTTESSVLEVKVRRGAGSTRGVVTDNQGRAVHDAVIAAIPDLLAGSNIFAEQPYPTSRTDQNGGFEILGLRPGAYRLFAWSVLENQALRDPEFLKKFEGKGTAITVQEREVVVRNLKIVDER